MAKKNAAVILAAGSGRRMRETEPKQFIRICGKPMLYYSVAAFHDCDIIDEIVIVVGEGQVSRCYDEVVDTYYFEKPITVVEGGAERYHSSYCGIKALDPDTGMVFIHDAARPCIDEETILRAYEQAKAYDACTVGVPVKDTIRRVKAVDTKAMDVLDRNELWQIQTPQVFEYQLVKSAYEKFFSQDESRVTDDATVVEWMMRTPVIVTMGSYRNLKVTTPEDLAVAEIYLKEKKGRRRKKR